jgi:acetate---CoA ligase (ADP-forming)
MIADLRVARLFDGYRGAKPASRAALAQILVDVSHMAMALGSRLAEMDINPVFVDETKAIAADALLILR